MCHYFPEFGKHGGHFTPRCHRALQTQMCGAYGQCWFLNFLRQEHWSMGIYLLWMVTCHFRPGAPLSIQRRDIQVPFQGISSLLYPEDQPLRSKTYATNDTVELYCPWCERLPLTATAHSRGNPTERVFNFSFHDFLVVWNKVIEVTKLGDFIQPLVPHMARHNGPSIDAAQGTGTRKEIRWTEADGNRTAAWLPCW